jgi:Fe-S-cluster containining protein
MPGRCCSGFNLGRKDGTFLEQLVWLATIQTSLDERGVSRSGEPGESDTHAMVGLPFLPLFQHSCGDWMFWCPLLDIKTGRCSDYENRPALCRSYKAGSDYLCIMKWRQDRESGSYVVRDFDGNERARIPSPD